MKGIQLLNELRHRGIEISRDGDDLRVRDGNRQLTQILREQLREQKSDILTLFDQFARDDLEDPIVPSPRSPFMPLSFAQERMWLLEQIEDFGNARNIPATVRLHGDLNIAALERAVGALIERHEILRTRIVTVDGQGMQVIEACGSVVLAVDDVSGLGTAKEIEDEVHRIVSREVSRPFDLTREPPLRVRLVRTAADDHVATMVIHHIASDGWSRGVLLREIAALYGAFVAGHPSPLPPLAVQYADYAVWQRAWLSGERLERQLSYWKARLSGAPSALELPTDRGRPAQQSFCGSRLSLALPAELTAKLRALARAEGATLFMVLLAAFQAVLSRWSGQDDIVVGTPTAGRTRSKLEGLIGLFVNTLALRTELGGDPSFRELVGRVREASLGAYAHQDLPFEKLVAELRPAREPNRHPLFQVLFALQNVPQATSELPGLTLSRMGDLAEDGLDPGLYRLDLALYLHEAEHGLWGFFQYTTDLFDAATIRRLSSHVTRLLEQVAEDADRRISAPSLLPAAELTQLVEEWNATSADYPREQCLHHLFMAQAAKTPDAVAVVYEGRELSYRELDRRSNRLAHHLRGLGVGPESIVGLCMRRSFELVVALLGILKSGGAYLSLDPNFPPERLSYMLTDAGASIVLTKEAVQAQLCDTAARKILLDAELSGIEGDADSAPADAARPDNLAYVIYTSGSTGRPKGVMGTHRNACKRLSWDALEGEGGKVYCQRTSLNFLDAYWEVFMPLLCGGRTVLVGPGVARDPLALTRLLGDCRVERLALVPSLLHSMLALPIDGAAGPSHLRMCMIGGDAVPSSLAEAFFDRWPQATLLNVYGMSETWDVSWYNAGRQTESTLVPIGRPISNTQVYVLDRHGQPAAIGVAGELHVGGTGLARGYLGRAGLTAERFVPSPFGDGCRLYRTGDLARWREDGELEYLGRIDHQVKLRGYRIELGEIEAYLQRHARVREAVVAMREDEGDRRLVAYYVEEAGEDAIGVENLRAYGLAGLPDYMVPSAFVKLKALPSTPNGKADRKSLPTPDSDAYVQRSYVAPRNETEQVLAGIWCDVLRLERIGAHDNFFELGGHSLLAMRVSARLNEAFGIELPLRALFDAPTLARLAETIEISQWERSSRLSLSEEASSEDEKEWVL